MVREYADLLREGEQAAREMFDAAYSALTPFMPFTQARGFVAERVVVEVASLRHAHGLGHMLALAESRDERTAVTLPIKMDMPATVTHATPAALHAAVRAAARAAWDWRPEPGREA